MPILQSWETRQPIRPLAGVDALLLGHRFLGREYCGMWTAGDGDRQPKKSTCGTLIANAQLKRCVPAEAQKRGTRLRDRGGTHSRDNFALSFHVRNHETPTVCQPSPPLPVPPPAHTHTHTHTSADPPVRPCRTR